MQRILSLTWPSALVLTTSLHAQGRLYSQDSAEQAPASSTPQAPVDGKPSGSPVTETQSTAPNDKVDDKAQEAEEDEADSETTASFITRQSRAKSVEIFVDYNTFQGNKEYFTPVAYGVKGYIFHTSDIKLGLSVAGEDVYYGFDKKYLDPATGNRLRFKNIKRQGTAFRYAAHGQYFANDTTNIGLSVFGSSGILAKGKGFEKDYYARTGISLSLGNQWSWKEYTISLNWLSLTYNANLRVGGQNLLSDYPSNRNGGMIILSGLSFGEEW